ncbi:MAG: hypothetical protein IJP54_08635 [Synergistaceae bacterium]|nr:hypothetical protein [Synergistaceae bacterium]
MPYNVNHLVTTAELKQAATVFKLESDKAIKSLAVSGRTISFFTSENGTGTAVATVDIPKDLFLDQAKTTFVQNFTFSAATYPGAVNPSLDGKPVFVLAVKGSTDPANGTANDTISYSFIDVSALVDTYTTAAGTSSQVLTISGYTVSFNISSTAGNIIKSDAGGLYATNRLSSYTAGNIVTSDANGAPQDGGIPASTLLVNGDVATMAEINEMLAEVGFTIPNS